MKKTYKIDTQKAKDCMLLQMQALSLEPVMMVEVKPFTKNRTLEKRNDSACACSESCEGY